MPQDGKSIVTRAEPLAEATAVRNQVFVSYSHEDKEFLEKLRKHLSLLERRNIKVWTDKDIAPGMKWRDEISAALAKTKVAVLMISTDFLTSSFIADKELPPLLAAASNHGVKILPVLVKDSGFEEFEELACYQAVNDKPLARLHPDTEREAEFVKIMQMIRKAMEGEARPSRQAMTAASAPVASAAREPEVDDEADDEDALSVKDGLCAELAAMVKDPSLQTLSIQVSDGEAEESVELMQVTEGHNGGLLLEVLSNDELPKEIRLRGEMKRHLQEELGFHTPEIHGDRFWRIHDEDEDGEIDLDAVTGDVMAVLEHIFGLPDGYDAEQGIRVVWQVFQQ